MKVAIINPEVKHLINLTYILCKNNNISCSRLIDGVFLEGTGVMIFTKRLKRVKILWITIDIYPEGFGYDKIPEEEYNSIYSEGDLMMFENI